MVAKVLEKSVYVGDSNELNRLLGKFHDEGADSIHVLADFDRTLTYGLDAEGKNRTPTVISQLRADPKYLGEAYKQKAEALFAEYNPIEIDKDYPLEDKKAKMYEWWKRHFDWISENGLTKDLISLVVNERPLRFRDGAKESLELLAQKEIPLVIMSAAPGDMLVAYLEREGLMQPNVYVIANRYEFDEEGKALHILEPIIHTYNKNEVVLRDHPIYEKIRDRKNVFLLGDSTGDADMIEGFAYDGLIRIGFLNQDVEKNLTAYTETFDIVLTGDQDFTYVTDMLKEVVG